jgi:hypothetical protein
VPLAAAADNRPDLSVMAWALIVTVVVIPLYWPF